MGKNLTTKEHFKIFCSESTYWIDYFGLIHHEIEYQHYKFDKNESTLAQCVTRVDNEQRQVLLRLSVDWYGKEITDFDLRKAAFHEVMEFMYDEIFYNLPERTRGGMIHTLIRTMENSVFKNNYYQRFSNVGTKAKCKT